MHFRLELNVTEQDYLDFNTFHITRSPYGKKQSAQLKKLFIGLACVAAALFVLLGFEYVSMLVLAVLMLLYLIFLDKFMAFTMKQTIKNMKKQGKLPYTPSAVMEFNEETIIEATPDQKTEFRYASLERVSVVDNQVIYLHQDNVRGYILPFSSFRSQEEKDAFLEFIKTKCPVVDTY